MWEGKLSLIVGSEQVRCIFEDSQENVIRYLKFATSHEETGVNLSFSLISFKMEFNPLTMRQPKLSKQLLTVNSIFRATSSTCIKKKFGIEKVSQLYSLFSFVISGRALVAS